jgi:predicted hydrocarbon binding protein/KaiC/GvpD/RAD55 family RecA-like ATPase
VGDHIVSSGARDDMEKRGLSVAEIQEVPKGNLILLSGPPGAGKSTFCHQVVLNSIAVDRPVIFVTSEQSPDKVVEMLSEKGMGGTTSLSFVDSFTETVGLRYTQRSDTVCADCADLNSLSIAITKVQERMASRGSVLVFDSLTSPYLFNGVEIVKFMRLFLSKFASEGNSVLALMDEGCGKEEDLGAMMSVADGILRIEIKESSRIINVVKYPRVEPIKIEVPAARISEKKIYDTNLWDREMIRRMMEAEQLLGQQFDVNIFWPNFALWSSMLWDPRRFTEMIYDVWKKYGSLAREMVPLFPRHQKFLFKLLIPRDFSRVKDMKKLCSNFMVRHIEARRDGIMEYLEDISKTDEHYFRLYESRECCGFENVGATMASIFPPMCAGVCKGFDREERDWNAIETKCIGLGHPYCEFKLVPGDIVELRDSLGKDNMAIEKINERLMERLMGFLLDEKPLVERPKLGSDFIMAHPEITLPAMVSERYRMALRMGGARAGKKVGERLTKSGLTEDQAVKRVIDFMNYCKVGKITMTETIRIKDSSESLYTKYYTTKWDEPSCYFTTGFLNGFFSVVKNQHVREIKCIAAGASYCECEIT